tara:strand:+ start:72 stop:677 length:606 start_codon:yes stop_codon:yes gene_type:complete
MFTGIITHIGSVRRVTQNGDRVIEILCPFDTNDLDIGASVSCSGACMTVIEKGPSWFRFSVSSESLSKTNLGTWVEGTNVNLERALRIGDEIGGHIVSGHVDGVGHLENIRSVGASTQMNFDAPPSLCRFIASKGSITVDGISLTVNTVTDSSFAINVIPHTWSSTTLSEKKLGDPVNLEIDILARYVARLQEFELNTLAG